MTRDDVQMMARMLLTGEISPSAENGARLIDHVSDLQTFVIDLTEWLASPPSPMKTATYYQIQARAQRLRNVIEPPKSLVMF
jgi:hypothetical protein